MFIAGQGSVDETPVDQHVAAGSIVNDTHGSTIINWQPTTYPPINGE
jgi:hypothetical protein